MEILRRGQGKNRYPKSNNFDLPIDHFAIKIAGGAFAGGVLLLAQGADTVHAHEVDTTDTPERLFIEPGSSVWTDASRFYSQEQIEQDLITHGIPRSEWPFLVVPAGSYWQVSPEVVNQYYQQHPESRPVSSQPSAGSTKIVLEENETVWGEVLEAGVPEDEIGDVVRWLEDMNPDMPPMDQLPVGFTFELPDHLLPNASPQIVPLGADINPPTIVIEQGSSIIETLEDAGVEDPFAVSQVIIDINDIEDDRNIMPGQVLIVPADVLPPAIDATVEPPLPIENMPTQEPRQNPEVPSAPETTTVAPVALNSVMEHLRGTYTVGYSEIAGLGEYFSQTLQHPELNEQLGITPENVSQLFLLPERQMGFDFVVNPQTCNAEAIASAPMIAFVMAVQDYARWLTENDPRFIQYQGFEFEIGDLNSGVHNTHQFITAVDLRSRFPDAPAVLFPDGPLFMSGANGFDIDFTKVVYQFARSLTYNGEPLLDQIITGSKQAEGDLTGTHSQGDWVAYMEDHPDHTHINLRDAFEVPGFFSYAVPISCDDPATGGHTPFEQPITELPSHVIPVEPTAPTTEPTSQETATGPEIVVQVDGYWVVAPNHEEVIANSNLSDSQKEFLSMVTNSVMGAIDSGATVNPRVAIAQAIIESGWGEGKGAREGNNIFSVKANVKWLAEHPNDIVWIYDDEFDANGNKIPSAFKKYATLQDAFIDYALMITEAEHYDDAERCRGDDEAYLNGLIHELRQNCTIGRMQGENGVMSYATNEEYVQILMGVINSSLINELVVINPDELERQATEEWAQLHAA